ncbi:hypothetical protein ACIN8IBEIGE_50104 [Acinetobacter sp. 8I-beige]|nr:hypothetical protein ACIN8IBEIGE_50104 [Acinetobacter sp. 8I-beige]
MCKLSLKMDGKWYHKSKDPYAQRP